MNLQQLKLRLAVLTHQFNEIEAQLAILDHQQEWSDDDLSPLMFALERRLITVRQQAGAALFEAMLHTPHRQYLKFIEGKA